MTTRSPLRVFKTWYRSYTPDGRLWCESSDKKEVLESSKEDYTFEIQQTFQYDEIKAWYPYEQNSRS